MIDFHSHILPKIDDGSSSTNESLELLSLSKQQGVDCMVATPHFYASDTNPERFLAARLHSFRRLSDAASNRSLPEIIPGAEVSYFEGMSDCCEISELKIEGTSLVMVEMPMCRWSGRMLSELSSIHEKIGLIPLIAHVDRYIKLLHDKKIIDKLSGLPVLIQANASFFTDKRTSRLALSLMSKNKIHLLGSDCHNVVTRRPNLGEAYKVIETKLGNEAIKKINENEKLVFADNPSVAEALFI